MIGVATQDQLALTTGVGYSTHVIVPWPKVGLPFLGIIGSGVWVSITGAAMTAFSPMGVGLILIVDLIYIVGGRIMMCKTVKCQKVAVGGLINTLGFNGS